MLTFATICFFIKLEIKLRESFLDQNLDRKKLFLELEIFQI